MKENVKLLIIAVIAVIVSGAVLVFVMFLPSEGEQIQMTDNNAILLFDKSGLKAEDITIENESGTYRMLGYDYSGGISKESDDETATLVYTMQDYPDSALSKTMTDSLVSECKTITATRLVDRSGKKYSDYGLDKPKAKAEIVYSDDTKVIIYLGNTAPDNSGIYCQVNNDSNVYLVNSATVDMFFTDGLQFFDKVISKSLGESEKIAGIDISGKGYSDGISIGNELSDTDFCEYTMILPYRECCDSTAVEKFGETFFPFSASAVEKAEVKSDDLKKYGLDEPYMSLSVKTDSDSRVDIIVSEKNGDGIFYLMKTDGNIIYRFDVSENEWYNVSYKDFLNDSLIIPNMNIVKSVDISSGGEETHYSFNHKTIINDTYDEAVTTTVYVGDKQINYLNLSNFINNISSIGRQSKSPESSDGCEKIFTMLISFADEEETADKLEFYQTGDNRTFAVLNGNIECYTDSEYTKKVISQVSEISKDEPVEVLKEEVSE